MIADAADREREEREPAGGEGGAEEHDRDRGDRVGLEQVGRHPGAITDVVADVVGDDSRVARVVLGDAGLDLPDEIGADVGGLRVDAAAQPGEDRDQRAAEGEADQVVDRIVLRDVEPARQHAVVAGDAEEAEADDEQPRDGAGAERDVQGRREAALRRLRRADVRAHGDVHADEAGGGRKTSRRSGSRSPCPSRAGCRSRSRGTGRSRRGRSSCTAGADRPPLPPALRARSRACARTPRVA